MIDAWDAAHTILVVSYQVFWTCDATSKKDAVLWSWSFEVTHYCIKLFKTIFMSELTAAVNIRLTSTPLCTTKKAIFGYSSAWLELVFCRNQSITKRKYCLFTKVDRSRAARYLIIIKCRCLYIECTWFLFVQLFLYANAPQQKNVFCKSFSISHILCYSFKVNMYYDSIYFK